MANRTPRRPHTTDMRPHFVYQLWGRKDCLYVGMTMNLPKRLATHSRSPWWPTVERITAEFANGRTVALDVEQETIMRLEPLYNIQHVEARTVIGGLR